MKCTRFGGTCIVSFAGGAGGGCGCPDINGIIEDGVGKSGAAAGTGIFIPGSVNL